MYSEFSEFYALYNICVKKWMNIYHIVLHVLWYGKEAGIVPKEVKNHKVAII